MAKPLVSDELWAVGAPLLPPHRPRDPHKPGRRRIPDRACLTGIIFVLKTGIQWEDLPQELGCGSGMTCWRRLRDWQRAGGWRGLHRVLLHRLAGAGRIDWSRASADAARVPAKGGAKRRGRTPRTGARRGRTTTW
jgi:transposase